MHRRGMSDGTETNPNILETLSRGLALLNAFGAGCPSMSISDAANVLAVSRAAARRFLITLEAHGYLVRKGRTFHLTPRVLELGHSYFAAMDLPTLARPFLTDLTEATGETTGLYILHDDDVILLMGIPSRHHITAMVPPGTAYPAYLTAVGRVFLARFSETELSEYLQRLKIRHLTPYTVRNKTALRAELTKTSKAGYAAVSHELAFGYCGLAMPIVDAEGHVVAAINVALQAGADPEEIAERALPMLREAAAGINWTLERRRC